MGGRGGSSGMGSRSTTAGGGGGAFTEFPDKASSGFTYYGDGKDQVDFFRANSNYDELIRGMSYDERSAFRAWASGHFMDGQQYKGWDRMTGSEQIRTQIYDKYLDRTEMREGVVLSRSSTAELVLGAGNRAGNLKALQAAEGSVVTSKGSMSFGAASEGLAIGSGRGKSIEYKLKIPAGSKGPGMWIGDTRINGWGVEQREFMTNRDSVFKVGKTTYNSTTRKYTVELTYMGHTQHDYGRSGKIPGI